MTKFEEYQEHIQYTHNAFCRIVIRHASIDAARKLYSKWKREISLNVSINTLLGSPRQLVCRCCGMPLNDDGIISRENDGSYNEDYCKWCYSEGDFTYKTKDALLDYLVCHMPNPENLDDDTRRKQFDSYLSLLKHWK